MSSTGAHPHCQPCENLKHWIEIIVRDEHNQPFEGVSGVLIDAMKNKHPVELNASPILIENLAPGPVEIELDYDQWLKAAQDKSHPRNEEKAKPVEEFSSSYSAHKSGPVVYQEITTGDLTKLPKEIVLPTNHQKGKAGTLKLFTDKTYILQVRAYKFITLRVGMFFDGTANNTYSAQWGKQQLENYYRKWKAKYDAECEINSKNSNGTKKEVPITALSNDCFTYPKKENFILSLFKNDEGEMETVAGSASNELTNVQKLFDLYSQDKFFKEKNMFSHAEYITGIGTGNSTAIAPADESIVVGQGLGIGKYGVTAKVTTGIQTLSQNIEQVTSTFEKVLEMKVDGIEKLQFDVFGFSRGAAAARHFINMVLDGENGEFAKTFTLGCQKADLPLIYAFDWGEVDEIKANCEITFAGLFDTVASVVNIFSKNSPLGLDLNTHTDNGDVRLWIDPKRVRHAVHLTADPTIECRDNFSLNHLNSTDEEHFHEFVLPGAHSDIGGGYHSRLSFDNPDYLLPVLEKKLVKRVSRTFSDRWD
ncbi:VgrG protein [Vibrio cholerae]|nr:VgrG protein [Vibrio cholerae]